MSPSILQTPKGNKTEMSVKKVEISNMEVDRETDPNKRKREASASTSTRQRSKKN